MTWLSRAEGSATAAAVEPAWEVIGVRPSRRIRLPDWEMVKRAVAAGMRVAAVSRLAVEAEIADGRLFTLPVPGWRVVRPLSVIRPRDPMLLAEQFLEVSAGPPASSRPSQPWARDRVLDRAWTRATPVQRIVRAGPWTTLPVAPKRGTAKRRRR